MPKAATDVRIEALPCAAGSLKEEPPTRPAKRQFQTAGKGLKCLISLDQAGMAELVDARDLKSLGAQALCRFDPGCPHHESCAEDPAARRSRER